MRRLSGIVVIALLAACGGGGKGATDPGVVDRSRAVPRDVQTFLDRVADPHTLTFTATYNVLNKNGGAEHTVRIESDPPATTVEVDGHDVRPDDDVTLSSYGIFSGFLAQNPSAAIEAAARRADADEAELTTKEVAGVRLDCISIPVQQAQTSLACLTPEGIFGFVDNPSVRYELTDYAPGA